MELKRAGSRRSQKGPPDWFTGDVTIEPLNNPPEPSRIGVALGKLPAGREDRLAHAPARPDADRDIRPGWTQCEGEERVEIRTGDVIWCPPNHKHWHGATDTTPMTHIAVQESLNGSPVTWMEHVTDEQYLAAETAE